MSGKIVIFDNPDGPVSTLAPALQEQGYSVNVGSSAEDVLAAVRNEQSQLLIAMATLGSGATLAEKLYDSAEIPIMLILSTAGEETMTFLRRHPGVIGVYYTPINKEKFLERVRKFFQS